MELSHRILLLPDPIDLSLQRHRIQFGKGKAEEQTDPPIKHEENAAEHVGYFLGSPLDGRRIGAAPVRGHGLARPYRTDLLGGVVADGENEVQLRRARLGKLAPIFTTQSIHRNSRRLQLAKRLRPYGSRRVTSGTIRGESWAAFEIQDGFSHDRPRRVAG